MKPIILGRQKKKCWLNSEPELSKAIDLRKMQLSHTKDKIAQFKFSLATQWWTAYQEVSTDQNKCIQFNRQAMRNVK